MLGTKYTPCTFIYLLHSISIPDFQGNDLSEMKVLTQAHTCVAKPILVVLRLLFVTALFPLFLSLPTFAQEQEAYVLMVSFDGFRHDYIDTYDAPTFKELRKTGSHAEGLICSFPSKTFPNHYTLVTGLYPGSHGLVGNNFIDMARQDTFTIRKRHLVEDAYFYGGVPLWQLVQQYGMKSASYFWVGSEAPVAGRYPNYYQIYDGSVPNEERISQVMDWFQLPDSSRPQFVTLYFSLVDSEGHKSGPESPQTGRTVLQADSLLQQILTGLDTIDLPINVIITSDHGMYPVQRSEEYFISLPNLLGSLQDSFQMVNSGTNVQLYGGSKAACNLLYERLKTQEAHFSIYRKHETPEEWHYRDHPRIGDLILSAEPGYMFSMGYLGRLLGAPLTIGVHGYDPYTTPEMNGIFLAKGPAIVSGKRLPPFENVHVYPFVASLLGIPGETPDSDGKVLEELLLK